MEDRSAGRYAPPLELLEMLRFLVQRWAKDNPRDARKYVNKLLSESPRPNRAPGNELEKFKTMILLWRFQSDVYRRVRHGLKKGGGRDSSILRPEWKEDFGLLVKRSKQGERLAPRELAAVRVCNLVLGLKLDPGDGEDIEKALREMDRARKLVKKHRETIGDLAPTDPNLSSRFEKMAEIVAEK